jgi:hypothetical protein
LFSAYKSKRVENYNSTYTGINNEPRGIADELRAMAVTGSAESSKDNLKQI